MSRTPAAPQGLRHDEPRGRISGNVLVVGGHLAGVLDVGSLGATDPALDLISAWNLLEAGPRQVFRSTDLEWNGARPGLPASHRRRVQSTISGAGHPQRGNCL